MDESRNAGQASKSDLHEKFIGAWNTLEIYYLGSESIYLVNGYVVNRVKNVRYDIDGKTISVTKGKIQLQSEGTEVYYKNMSMAQIKAFPTKYRDL